MSRSQIRNGLLGVCAAACMVVSAAAIAREQMSANVRLCQDFRQKVVMEGQIDLAPTYLAADYNDHNLQFQDVGLQAWMAKYRRVRAASAGRPRRSGATPMPVPRWRLSAGDLVVFITPLPARHDPVNLGRMLPASTHFDVFRVHGGKIVEHWD